MAIDPVGIGLAGLSFGASLFGSSAQKRAARRALRQAKEDAKFIEKLGRREAMDVLEQGDRLVGAQKVAFAGSGVDLSSGTPLDVMAEALADAELEALRTIEGRKQEAQSLRRGAASAAAVARSNSTATILGGANQAAQTLGAFYLRS